MLSVRGQVARECELSMCCKWVAASATSDCLPANTRLRSQDFFADSVYQLLGLTQAREIIDAISFQIFKVRHARQDALCIRIRRG